MCFRLTHKKVVSVRSLSQLGCTISHQQLIEDEIIRVGEEGAEHMIPLLFYVSGMFRSSFELGKEQDVTTLWYLCSPTYIVFLCICFQEMIYGIYVCIMSESISHYLLALTSHALM